MAKKQTKKTAKKAAAAVKKAGKGKAAKVKPAKVRAKADAKALHGNTKPWTAAEVDEAFRRFQVAMPEPKGELHHISRARAVILVGALARSANAVVRVSRERGLRDADGFGARRLVAERRDLRIGSAARAEKKDTDTCNVRCSFDRHGPPRSATHCGSTAQKLRQRNARRGAARRGRGVARRIGSIRAPSG